MIEWDWQTFFLFAGTLFFAFICLRYYDMYREKEKIFYLILGIIPCFFLFAFRHSDVGWDLRQYAISVSLADYKYIFMTEKGTFAIEPFSRLIKSISKDLGGIQPFIFLTSLVQFFFVIIFLRIIHQKGINIVFVFLIYFSVIQLRSCSMVRNGLAISASYCAYSCLFDFPQKNKLYWLFTICAIGFHNSAIINIPIYFLCKPLSGDYWGVRRAILCKILTLAVVFIFILFIQWGYFSIFLSDFAEGKYSNYVQNTGFGIGNLIVRIPLIVFFSFYLSELKLKYGNNIICFFYLMIFDLFFSQLRYFYSDFERFTQYSAFGEIILISLFYDFIRKKVQFPFQLVYFVIIAFYFVYYMYRWSIVAHYGLMPYKFMFQL